MVYTNTIIKSTQVKAQIIYKKKVSFHLLFIVIIQIITDNNGY